VPGGVPGEVPGEVPGGVPGNSELRLRQWLAQRNLGLVPVAAPSAFAWPGRFVGRAAGTDGWSVLFGVPPGVIAGAPAPAGRLEAAFVVAPADLGRAVGLPAATTGRGVVELLAVAAAAEAPMRAVERATALAGRGLEGDRYAAGAGTFSDARGRGHDLTLVEAQALPRTLAPLDARRNVIVRGIALDDLIGRRFRIGDAECLGQRRCEPCAHLERLTTPGVLRALVHRGGLRADVLTSGELRVGDPIVALD
jgi:hypothetical protein